MQKKPRFIADIHAKNEIRSCFIILKCLQVFSNGDHRLMRTDEEVVAIVVRDSEMLQENIKRGVAWLNSQRPLLQEYNEVDRHTMPMTGDLIV